MRPLRFLPRSFAPSVFAGPAALICMPFIFPAPVSCQEARTTTGGETVITILFDNFTAEQELEAGWGFAALVETRGHTILFDTGADGGVLLHNMRALDVDPDAIEAIVISHAHGDHTNGLEALRGLGIRPRIYLLEAFPEEAVEALAGPLELILAEPGQEIVPGVRTTGVVGSAIPEQALILDTRDGPLVLTGCAHPGPLAMVDRAAELTGQPVYGLMGGLHLLQTPPEEVSEIISQLEQRGVKLAGASHCTGAEAMAAFKEAFGEGYLTLGVGRVIWLPVVALRDAAP